MFWDAAQKVKDTLVSSLFYCTSQVLKRLQHSICPGIQTMVSLLVLLSLRCMLRSFTIACWDWFQGHRQEDGGDRRPKTHFTASAKRNIRQSITDTKGDHAVAVFLEAHYTFQKSCLDFPVNCKTVKQMDVKSHRRGEQCVLPNWACFSLWCLFPGGIGDITPNTETFYTWMDWREQTGRWAERKTTLELPESNCFGMSVLDI